MVLALPTSPSVMRKQAYFFHLVFKNIMFRDNNSLESLLLQVKGIFSKNKTSYIGIILKWNVYENCSTYAWYIIIVTNSFGQQSISDFPCKYTRTFSFEICNFIHHRCCSYPRFGSSNSSWFDRARLIVSVKQRHRTVKCQIHYNYLITISSLYQKQMLFVYLPKIFETQPLET